MKGRIIPRRGSIPVSHIDLRGATREELEQLSTELGLGLSAEEMEVIREHFLEEGRNPTDVELQAFGQAWSEHCCYKSSKPVLRENMFCIESEKVILKGDAGVVEFDDEHAYALRIESHNHPSALEPYGGAATGIGGILRDVVCMGAQPVALIDPLFFGPLDTPHKELPPGVKHPKYLFSGVVAGIRDYGNRVGIPTVVGGLYIHPGYLGNCLVNVGCVGIVKKTNIVRNAVKNLGDVFILAGGRTGRDGIHGVTFASRVLTERSEEDRGAVQLGDPITKEPLIHACLEANEKGLVSGMKDLGGGGLSCVVGEMALSGGFGAEVHLERVPLKEPDMHPWEIWVSESQERMMLSVKPEHVDKVMDIFRKWDVEANIIGRSTADRRVRVYYHGARIMDVDLEFLTGGPEYCRVARKKPVRKKERLPSERKDYSEDLLAMLSNPNICSRDWIIRQYDHEVRASTVVKPLQGRPQTPSHGDGAVIKPLEDSYRGLALAVAFNPRACEADPFIGGKLVIDEVCRNLVAMGARPDSLTDCLNFGNPEVPEEMYVFTEVVRGMGKVASALELPFPSGNVSFYNESPYSKVPPTAVVLGAGIMDDIRDAVTSDLKSAGDSLYLVGRTTGEMGGSEYLAYRGGSSRVPDVDIKLLKKAMDSLLEAMHEGTVAACHDVSTGGLAVTLAEMCIGGWLGAEVRTAGIGRMKYYARYFSEGASRWVVEVKKGKEKKFESIMKGVPFTKLGTVKGSRLKMDRRLDVSLDDMWNAWSTPLWEVMG